MTISVAAGSFQKSGSQTYPVDQLNAISGLSFQPKVLFLSSIAAGTTSATVSFTDIERISFGWTTGSTANYCVAWGSDDSTVTANSNTYRKMRNDYCMAVSSGAATQYPLMKLKQFETDGASFSYDQLNDTGVFRVQWLALGGADITNVKAGQFTANNTTGNQAITGVGFQPDIVFFITGNTPTTTHPTAGQTITNPHLSMTMGVAKSSTARGVMCLSAVDNVATTDSARYQRTDKCIAYFTEGTVTMDAEADFVSQDSDGFTINWSDAPSTQQPIFYLAIKGGSWNIGNLVSPSNDTEPQTQAVTGLNHQPKGLFVFGHQGSNSGVIQTNSKQAFGWASGTGAGNQISVISGNMDNTTIPTSMRSYRNDYVYRSADLGTVNVDNVASGNEATYTVARAALNSFDSTGFTLNWDLVDTNARQLLYVTFSDNIGASLSKTINETLNLTEANNKVIGKNKTINETLNLTETLNKTLGKSRTINETVNLTEVLNKKSIKSFSINESLSLIEDFNRAITRRRTINETVNLTEGLVKIFFTPTATLLASALELRFSGGTTNSVTTASRGGAMSNTAITDNTLNNAWDDITSSQSVAGVTEYRCFYVYNTSTTLTAYNFNMWIDTTTPAGDSIEIAVGSAAMSGTEQGPLTNETTAPTGVSFSTAPDEDSATNMGDIPPLGYRSFWMKRIVPAGTSSWSDNILRIRASFFSDHT